MSYNVDDKRKAKKDKENDEILLSYLKKSQEHPIYRFEERVKEGWEQDMYGRKEDRRKDRPLLGCALLIVGTLFLIYTAYCIVDTSVRLLKEIL